ncbi:ABC transporter substrate-binding protein [Nafulsella turpanensis]|uniref:ABC transporter substrate-binding protein n=1 Tax=Nafulsella turpanensis TaxID=1265690 RepID=UPI00135F109A|nr:ABC transporter substrate-binding protein [Nafulsella turpanensis]
MKNQFLILLLLMLPLQLAFGQNKNDYQQMYLRAKSLYQQERWDQAMDAFRELAVQQKNNSFAEYASFYYALSAIKSGELGQAKAMLQQVRQKYAGWDKMPEVNYWLSRVYLEEEAYRKAVELIGEIDNAGVKADAEEMAAFFLAKEEDLKLLRNLLKGHPEAKYLAKVIAGKISRLPLHAQDQAYLESLVQTYQLDRELLLEEPVLGKSERKDQYHVAVLLPFLMKDLEAATNLHDRYFVLDLYEGMKIAQQELAEENINIKLHAYDVERDSLMARSLLARPEMKKMDLLVGPLFPGPAQLAYEFAYNEGINMVNPLSVNSEVIRNNPYSFLFKPSIETQGKKAAEFAAKTFKDSTAVILYGPKERDSVLAYSYKQAIEEAGFRIKMIKEIPAGEENLIKKLLVPVPVEKDGKEKDIRTMLKEGHRLSKDSLGHVFVASEDELIVANSLSALMSRGDGLPMIGQEAWLRKNFVSFEQLERLGVYFVAPEYINYTGESFKNFRERYLEKVNHMPSRFAYIGYDLMMYYGRMMAERGNLFQKGAVNGPYQQGLLCTGYNFSEGNDNQCVPIVRFKDSALELVYQ